jgi:hypothetical protein
VISLVPPFNWVCRRLLKYIMRIMRRNRSQVSCKKTNAEESNQIWWYS